jgi:CMP-N-acetylneuraminic acid synthetase
MKNLILIPARSGSTRIKNKNIRMLGDKPLMAHTIETALQSLAGRVVVSTDSKEIAEMARHYGAETPFLRPMELSNSQAPSLWTILHALRWFKEHENYVPPFIAFCPPTNPFLRPTSISHMFHILAQHLDVHSIVTITNPKTHPFRIVFRDSGGKLVVGGLRLENRSIFDFTRTQDWPKVWEGSPACRLTRLDYFESLLARAADYKSLSGTTYDSFNCIGYEISTIEAFDIDHETDLKIADLLYGKLDEWLAEAD